MTNNKVVAHYLLSEYKRLGIPLPVEEKYDLLKDYIDSYSISLPLVALSWDEVDLINELHSFGVDLFQPNTYGFTSLENACKRGYYNALDNLLNLVPEQ